MSWREAAGDVFTVILIGAVGVLALGLVVGTCGVCVYAIRGGWELGSQVGDGDETTTTGGREL